METLPMFPLGLVAFPGGTIPLRLFEPRYLTLHDDLGTGSGEFGIVLIERGTAESQGGDTFAVGTVVTTEGSTRLDDGTVLLVATGTDRLRVDRWLPDDPYPMAEIERIGLPVEDPGSTSALVECEALVRRITALASELGADVGTTEPVFPRDPAAALYAMAAIAPIQDLDRQAILEAETVDAGADILADALHGTITVLRAQLGPQ